MNDAQKKTVITLLYEEIGREVSGDTSPNVDDRAYFDHLWETLGAFQDMWDNQQMVKEASNE